MSDTPRTAAALRAVNSARQQGEVEFIGSINDLADLARHLERELALSKAELRSARELYASEATSLPEVGQMAERLLEIAESNSDLYANERLWLREAAAVLNGLSKPQLHPSQKANGNGSV